MKLRRLHIHNFRSIIDANIDVMGKFNFHRYTALLEHFGIHYGLMLDDDQDKQHHKAVNKMLRNQTEQSRLAPPLFIPTHMESFLGKALPGRNDQKPVQILRELEAGSMEADRLAALRAKFRKALALSCEIGAPEVTVDSPLSALLNEGGRLDRLQRHLVSAGARGAAGSSLPVQRTDRPTSCQPWRQEGAFLLGILRVVDWFRADAEAGLDPRSHGAKPTGSS